jgi:hypothetical protein
MRERPPIVSNAKKKGEKEIRRDEKNERIVQF